MSSLSPQKRTAIKQHSYWRNNRCRLQLRMNKTELAAELGTTDHAVRAWITGRTVGRAETVQKLNAFLERAERVSFRRAR